jgi:aryl-alcohol dehydrogenase-like predicted oxidoreductase
VAGEHRTTISAVALAWLLAQPTVLAPLASATSAQQLSELLPGAELELSPGQLELLSAVSAQRAANASS